jgi:hypothetical protein
MQLKIPFSLRDLVILAIGASFAIFANMLMLVMVGQINERGPENERLSYYRWTWGTRKKHKQLYPQSKVVLLFDLCVVALVLSFGVLIWSMK